MAYGEHDNAIGNELPTYLSLTREVSYMWEYQQLWYVEKLAMPLREHLSINPSSVVRSATYGGISNLSRSKHS
jgi:hypothetical protein